MTKYNKFAHIIGEPKIGEGTWIGPFTVIDGTGGLEIGRNCDVSAGVQIYTHSTVKRCLRNKKFNDDGSVNRDEIEQKPVRIGNNTFLGANSVIMMGVNIGNNCVVGACSLVNKDVADFTVVGGVPAKKIGNVRKDGSIEVKK